MSADDQTPDETHVGMRIMRERAASIGAALSFTSAPGAGTRVRLTLPRALPASGLVAEPA